MGAGVGAALLILLGTLQVRWLDQVAQTITTQKRAALFRRGAAVASDLERELTRAFFWFQSSNDADTRASRTDVLLRRWRSWQQATPHPALLSAVWLSDPGSDGQPARLFRLSGSGEPQPATWPPALAEFQGVLGDDLRIAGLLPATAGTTGWLAIPPGFPGPPDRHGATVLLEIDGAHLSQVLLPAFTEAHPEPGSEGGPIRARLERPDGQPLFGAPADDVAFRSGEHEPLVIMGMRPDLATPDLLAGMQPPGRWPTDLVLHHVGPGDRMVTTRWGGARTGGGMAFGFGAGPGMSDVLLGPPPVFLRQAAGGQPANVLVTPPAPNLPPPPFIGRAHGGGWQLALGYADGAVDDLVTSLRRRNLALGFSILALLGSAIAALSLAVRRAHALAEQQRQFMASMSHELRTPLAVIGSAAENLRDGTVDEGLRVREYGTMIHTESRRLGAMLDHALRLAAGRDLRDELRLQPVDVHAVVDTAIASFAQELRTRGGQIERDVPANEDSDAATLTADPEALRQAIENVVGNALKYGGEPPWLAVRVSRVITTAGPAIEIAVEDRGMGIPPDEVGHVFEPFFRGREPLARQIRGTGLGLALVARVVQAHGGTVSVDSAAGRGSVFRLRLPCAAADTDEHRA
jgi:signal transduction histidine kinase